MNIKKNLILVLFIISAFATSSCNESRSEKLEDQIEDKSEQYEERSEDLDEAAEEVEEGVDDIEEAIDHFQEALEEIDNPDDRKAIRERIIKIMDDIEVQKSQI